MYQKVTVVGYLGQDPQTRYLPDGTCVANFSVATSEKWKDKGSGETKERTEWFRCSAFDRLAEVVGEYLKKGSLVLVEGTIRTREWVDKEGIRRFTPELQVRELKMMPRQDGASSRPQQEAKQETQKPRQREPGEDDFEDDIPFILNECVFDLGTKLERRINRRKL